MKKYTNIYAVVAVLMLFFASCSTDKVETPNDDTNSQFATVTFGAMLNDLANKSMQKSQFDQVPTCSDAEPAVALIEFSYGGANYSTTVNILSDASGYFTDYSDDLKIPVPTDGSTMVTITSFMVYDGDTSVASDAFYSALYGNLIWIAPKGDDSQFDGYVEDALPVSFEVFPGTKPYFDIEVLCFDRRMVNEYGYVFFDIVPKTIQPLCLFVNYCNEDGRHWVADYAIDLYFGLNADGIELYNHNNSNAMATTGMNGGEFSADPLCLMVPSPPANLGNDDPYLYLVIYPQDWTNSYGDIDNTPVPVQLSWNMVKALLNNDGTTNEYLHLLVGECENALNGDGTIPGGGDGECDPSDAQADCDGDGILNGVDNCPTLSNPNQEPDSNCDGVPDTCDSNDPQADCDGDGILNGVDNCPTVANSNQADLDGDGIGDVCDPDIDGDDVLNGQDTCPDVLPLEGQVDLNNNGCWTDPVTTTDPCSTTLENPSAGCDRVFLEDSNGSYYEITEPTNGQPTFYSLLDSNNQPVASVTVQLDTNNKPFVIINAGFGFTVDDLQIVVSSTGDVATSTCYVENNLTPATGENPDAFVEFPQSAVTSYPFFIKVIANVCTSN